jgi:hypothetical protein
LESARSYWFGEYWRKGILEANEYPIISLSKEKPDNYASRGWICLKNYWETSVERDAPLATEKRFRMRLNKPNIDVVSIIDQIRAISIEKLAAYRPELIVDGKLDEDYHPVFQVDLKTGYNQHDPSKKVTASNTDLGISKLSERLAERLSYSPDVRELAEIIREITSEDDVYVGGRDYSELDINNADTKRDMAMLEAPLWLDLQPTIYDEQYKVNRGKRAAGFLFWYLESNSIMFTFRKEGDFRVIEEGARYFSDCVQANQFPRTPGSHCARCLEYSACRPGPKPISIPSKVIGDERMIRLEDSSNVTPEQLPLGLKIKRKKRAKKERQEISQSDETHEDVRIFADLENSEIAR